MLIAGSGRSGTTWLQEVLNHRGDHRVIFEPFWGARVPLCVAFDGRQYLRPCDSAPQMASAARRIVRGELRNEWTDQFTRWGKVYRKRLIKTIRANLLLKWLHGLVPWMPVVFLMRHPLAVVESQLRKGWEYEPSNLFRSDPLVADHLAPFAHLPAQCGDPWERNLLFWCIENYVPLRQFHRGEIHIAFYESLVSDPQDEIRFVFGHLGRVGDPPAEERAAVPSSLAHAGGPIAAGEDPIGFWRKSVSADQLKRSREMLSAFRLDRIYGEGPMPDAAGAAAFLAENGSTPAATPSPAPFHS